jgi:hypothetical protein
MSLVVNFGSRRSKAHDQRVRLADQIRLVEGDGPTVSNRGHAAVDREIRTCDEARFVRRALPVHPDNQDIRGAGWHVSNVSETEIATLSQLELSSESVRTHGFACQMVFDVIGDLLAERRQLKQLVLHESIVGLLGKFPIHGRLAP